MKNLSILIAAVLLLGSCRKDVDDLKISGSEQSGSAMIKENQNSLVTRPFKASLFSTVDTNPAIPPTACSGDLPGFANPGYFLHGNATHLGTLIASSSRGQDVTCNLSFTTMLLTTTVSGQLAASNGDLIYYTGSDIIDASGFLTQTSTTGTITGTWTITGGTGRFNGASGSFTINGPVDFITGTFSFEAAGTITY